MPSTAEMTSAVAALILVIWGIGIFLLLMVGFLVAVIWGAIHAAKPVGEFMLWTASSNYGWIQREKALGRWPRR